jgi:hypothetical protein
MNTSDEYVWYFARNRLEALEWKDEVAFLRDRGVGEAVGRGGLGAGAD